ncbi:MAG TPA: hypothetical protein VIH13_03235, partial [Candidatus Hydromicrobium sp.]
MKKIACYSTLIILITSVFTFNIGCRSIFEGITSRSSHDNNDGAGVNGNSRSTEGIEGEKTENISSMAVIEAYQQNSSSNYFT